MGAATSLFWMVYSNIYDLIWDSPLTRQVFASFEQWCGPSGTAVDLGCGTGLSSAPLTMREWYVIGVDANVSMLKQASQHGRVASTLTADLADTGFPAAQADLVMASNVLHVHPYLEKVLAEAYRLVKPHGRIVCVWPSQTATIDHAMRADRESGRPLPATWLAGFLRVLVGVPGAFLGARHWSGREISGLVTWWGEANQMSLLGAGVVRGVQEYAVYSKE